MQFDLKQTVVHIADGGSNRLDVQIGEGTVSYTEHRPIQYIRDRGLLSTTRLGDEEPVDVRLDAIWEFVKSDQANSGVSIEDALKRVNGAAGWVSSETSDPCAPYSVDIVIHFMPPCTGVQGEVIYLTDFRYETLDHDAKQGTLNITGKCNVSRATTQRVSASSISTNPTH